MISSPRQIRSALTVLVLSISFGLSACAALQPPDPNGPRSNLPPYPITANEPDRLENAALAWKQLSQAYGLPHETVADLQPLTGTLRAIPSNLSGTISLPKVGASPTQTEEETRESLRRFIAEWRTMIGAEPNQLSLIERTDDASGIKIARYEQRPFRYPLRGGFGSLVIRFRGDRRIVDISSNCLVNTERLQNALNGLTPKVTAESAAVTVKSKPITVDDSSGQLRTFVLPETATVNVQQLVAYALHSTDRQTLELHLAWEIDVTNGPIKSIYLDALSDQVIAVA